MQHSLEPKYHGLMRNLMLARRHLTNHKYYEVIETLSKISNPPELIFYRDINYLFLISFYETGDLEGAKNHWKILKRLFENEKAPDLSNDVFKLFLKYSSRLIQIKKKTNKNSIKKLQDDIKNCNRFPGKVWLEKNLDKLLVNT